LSGANVSFFSFGQTEREENISETTFLLEKHGYFAAKKEKKHAVQRDTNF
jgi:hypothetical protein